MVKTTEELLESIRARIGEDTSDENIALIEDVQDTITDLRNKASNNINWEQKYHDNDAEWRQRYRDRFFNSEAKTDDDFVDDKDEKSNTILKFEDLFKEG